MSYKKFYIQKSSCYLSQNASLFISKNCPGQLRSSKNLCTLHTLPETQGYSSLSSSLYKEQKEKHRKACYTHFTDQFQNCNFEKCFDYYAMEDFKQLCQVNTENTVLLNIQYRFRSARNVVKELVGVSCIFSVLIGRQKKIVSHEVYF